MKARHKYLTGPFIYLLVFLFGFAVLSVMRVVTDISYNYLNLLLPELFPTYNFITEADGYQELLKKKAMCASILSLLIVNYIATRLDNAKYEYMISRTHGLYTYPEGLVLYLREFLLVDTVTAALIPALACIGCIYVPEKYIALASFPLAISYNAVSVMPVSDAVIYLSAFAVIGRLLSALVMVKKWRAMWLSGATE